MTARRYLLLAVVLGTLLVLSCSGGGGGGGGGSVASGGIGGTGITSTGTITGFGSVFVTENEYEVEAGTGISDDDDTNASEDDLRLGMVVTVRGTLNPDGTATANSITFDPNLEGPISAVGPVNADGTEREITVLGITVILSANGTVFDDETNSSIDFNSVAVGMFVEVSGFFDQDGKMRATFIQIQDTGPFDPNDREVEAKGTVDNYNGIDRFELVLSPLSSARLTVTNVDAAEIEDLPDDRLANGLFVEVEGTLDSLAGTTITATRIEGEGLDDDEGEVEVEGIVTGFVDLGNFQVAGIQVDASGASFEPASLSRDLDNGLQVEVEGVLSGGVLLAREVELRGGEIKIEATVASGGVDTVARTVTLGPLGINGDYLTVVVDNQTRLATESDLPPPFGLDDIVDGDFLKVEAYNDGSGRLIATEIKHERPIDPGRVDDFVLQGPTDPTTQRPNVSILDVTYATDASTDFEAENHVPLTQDQFFDRAEVGGVLVKVKDRSPVGGIPNGIADEVEFED